MDFNKLNKITGYTLLVVGLLLVILPLWQTYNIFSGKSLPPEVFKRAEVTPTAQNNNPFDIQKQVESALIKILPIDLINSTLNLASWMILMWILIFGGKHLADIGIKLIK